MRYEEYEPVEGWDAILPEFNKCRRMGVPFIWVGRVRIRRKDSSSQEVIEEIVEGTISSVSGKLKLSLGRPKGGLWDIFKF